VLLDPDAPTAVRTDIDAALEANPGITHLAICHCETATGVLNPITEIAAAAKRRGVRVILDAIASFAAFEIDAPGLDLEAIVLSSNKGLESVPGVAFVIAKRASPEEAAKRSVSLARFHSQWSHMERTGQWRFTPPTHVIAALATAIQIHQTEGGIQGRYARFHRVWHRLVTAMRDRGFVTLIPDDIASPIVTTFMEPADPNYSFLKFSAEMKKRGFIIFPGRLTAARTFRIGCMGRITDDDVDRLIAASRTDVGSVWSTIRIRPASSSRASESCNGCDCATRRELLSLRQPAGGCSHSGANAPADGLGVMPWRELALHEANGRFPQIPDGDAPEGNADRRFSRRRRPRAKVRQRCPSRRSLTFRTRASR
jgi:2-aminoethylphosphonate-pyruvate transaminase